MHWPLAFTFGLYGVAQNTSCAAVLLSYCRRVTTRRRTGRETQTARASGRPRARAERNPGGETGEARSTLFSLFYIKDIKVILACDSISKDPKAIICSASFRLLRYSITSIIPYVHDRGVRCRASRGAPVLQDFTSLMIDWCIGQLQRYIDA